MIILEIQKISPISTKLTAIKRQATIKQEIYLQECVKVKEEVRDTETEANLAEFPSTMTWIRERNRYMDLDLNESIF